MSVAESSPRTTQDWPDYYSETNCELLCQAGATSVAGYREWKSLGRQVKRGEHGIKLWAPIVRKDAESGERKVVNYRHVTVFDVAQTEPVEQAVAA